MLTTPAHTSTPSRYTVLFADLAGFTSLSEELDPDDVREFLNHLLQELCQAVEAHGGQVAKFLGDAVVAVFPALNTDTPEFSDVDRAIGSALMMQVGAGRLDQAWRSRLGRMVQLHLGLEAGGQQPDQTVRSDAISAAAQLQNQAAPGEILVGPLAYAATRERFRFAPTTATGGARRLVGTLGTASAPTVAGPVGGGLVEALLKPHDPDDDVELRQATVIFAELAHATRLRAALPAQEFQSFEQDLLHALSEAVERYEGTVERLVGCSAMALFGAPIAHEDDPERALRTAVLMQELARGLERRWGSRLGSSIELQIGINTGTVVAGGMVLGAGRAYAVTGDTMNTAARLRSAAGPGEILLGADSVRLVAHAAELEALAPISLKGKSKAVLAHRLRRLLAQPTSSRGLHRQGIGSQLVGREREMAVCLDSLSDLHGGAGGILSVVGEPGLGKSRLLAELRQQPAAQGILWLEGRTLSYSTELAYWPFLQILRQSCDIREGDDEGIAWAQLERRLRSLFEGDISEQLAYLATLMGLEITGELSALVRHLDADALRRQVLRAARLFFEQLARRQPLAVVLEDVHWIDASSEALAEHLLPLVGEVPILFCWASRPDSGVGGRLLKAAQDQFPTRLREILLQPLDQVESEQLLRNLLEDALPAAVLRSILDKADGNPFFVEEVIRGMIDAGAVVQDRTGKWTSTPAISEMAIPDTVQGVILARIDRLDEDLKRVLRLASVIGRRFMVRILEAITDAGKAIDADVGQLSELELIRRNLQAPELEYAFRHALVQETTYETIVKRRRRELHRRVAESVESLFPDRLEEFAGLLAFHAARGEDWERAHRYLLQAGDQAARIAADAEALAHYQHAMQACELALGESWTPKQRAALDRRIGEAFSRRGEFPDAERHLFAALDRLGSPYPQTARGVRSAILQQAGRQMLHRRLGDLVTRRHPDPDTARERAEIYSQMAWFHYTQDHEHFVLDVLWCLNEAEAAGDPKEICRGTATTGMILDAIPLPAVAARYHQRAVRIGLSTGNPVALGLAYLGLGIHHYDRGHWRECGETMELSRARCLEGGDLRGWSAASAWLFWMALYRGQFEVAREIGERMARYGEESGDGQLTRFGYHYRGAELSRSGDLESAVGLLETAVSLYRAVPEMVGMAHAAGDLGLCYARLDRLPEALELLTDANGELDRRKLTAGGCVPPRAALAEVLVLAAEQDTGPKREQRIQEARKAARACLSLGRLHHESLLFGHRSLGSCCWLQGQAAAAEAAWKRAASVAEGLGAAFEVARTDQEVGRLTGDRPRLERALRAFEAMGSRFEFARTRQLLENA